MVSRSKTLSASDFFIDKKIENCIGIPIRKRSKLLRKLEKIFDQKPIEDLFLMHESRSKILSVSETKKDSLHSARIFRFFYMEMEATPRVELGVEVLQTSALPLGYVAIMERKTRLELATPTLARLCSTTELLPHYGDPGGT